MLPISIAFFALGTIIASFIGVLVARLYTGQGFVIGRSRCDACDAPLSSLALMPIISFVSWGGRARCCGARISWYAPLTELLLGGLFLLSYLKLGLTSALFGMLLSLSLLLALVLYDIAHQILPSVLLILFVVTSVITRFLIAPSYTSFFNSFFIAFLIALSLALIHVFSRGRAMGLADAPLSFGLALLTGSAAFSGFIFSFWIGAVIGIIILAGRPSGSRMGVEVPFAPYLAAGFLLAYFTQWNPFIFIATLSSH
ncbi:MAG: prepilin peptidase [Candidatus Paceibacterota bacterium]|jgi:prepilin signal peptidase PulO-like enzyme (type II secretory pathway)